MENELINTENKPQPESKAKYADMARKFMYLFIIELLLTVSSVLSIILAVVNLEPMIVIYFGIGAFVITILYAVILFLLGKYDYEFSLAGLFCILAQLFTLIRLFVPDTAMNILISLIGSVFSILYLLKFANAMSSRFLPVDLTLSDSWESYRKAYIYLISITCACVVFALIPFINILAGIVSIICALAAIGFLFWMLVLLYKSSVSMKAFANKPDEPNSDNAPVTPIEPIPIVAPENQDI